MAGSQRTRSKQKQQQAKQDGKRKRQSDVKQAEASPAACVRQLSENLPDLGELVPVDSFFDSYITTLNRQGASRPAPSGPGPGIHADRQVEQQLQAPPNFTYSATPAYLAQMGSKTLGDCLPSVPQLEVGRGLALKDGAPGGAGPAGMGGGLALGAGGGLGMPGEQQASQLVQNSLRTASGELGAPLTYPASSLAQLQQMLQGQSSFLGAGGGSVSQQLLELMRSGSLGNGIPAGLDWGNLYPMRALAAAAQGQGSADIQPNPGHGPALLAAMSAAQRGQQQAQQQQAQQQQAQPQPQQHAQQPTQQHTQQPEQQPQQDSRRALAASLVPRSSSPRAAGSGSAPPGRHRSQPHIISAANQAADMDQDDVSGDDAFPTEQANSYPDRDGSGKGDVSRNARQMMQNKAAQQRYRERRKLKVLEMEQALQSANARVEELHRVLKQNVALQEKALRFENQLAERDRQVQELQDQLQQAQAAAKAQPASTAMVAAPGLALEVTGADGDAAMQDTTEPAAGAMMCPPAFEGMSELKVEFQGHIMRLEQLIEHHRLREADPTGLGLPQEVIDAVNQMVEDSCRVCRRVQQEGMQVLNLITADPGKLPLVGSTSVEKQKWRKSVQALRLSPVQQGQILMWRQEHLHQMRELYEERQKLNLEALHIMSSGKGGQGEPDGADGQQAGSVDARLARLESHGYMAAARSNLELEAVLDNLKAEVISCTHIICTKACSHLALEAVLDNLKGNLKREQRTVLQFNWVLMKRILTPVQSALFLVHAWPSHCDGMALTNALCSIKTETGDEIMPVRNLEALGR